MKAKYRVISGIGILTALLTAFNNCGDSTHIDPLDEASVKVSNSTTGEIVDPTVVETTSPPQLTAVAYKVSSAKTLKLNVTGGKAPFTFTVSPNSGGSVAASTKIFTANQPGVTGIEVVDAKGRRSEIAVMVEAVAPVPAPVLKACVSPIGGTIAHGASAKFYLKTAAGRCSSQMRKCTNGILSGSYTKANCAVLNGVRYGNDK